eukprot:scaffold133099_cov39-Prasinocladus_malaysianus.AAC.1
MAKGSCRATAARHHDRCRLWQRFENSITWAVDFACSPRIFAATETNFRSPDRRCSMCYAPLTERGRNCRLLIVVAPVARKALLMPSDDMMRICCIDAAVREPVSRFVSDFGYYEKAVYPDAQLMKHGPDNRMVEELGYPDPEALLGFLASEQAKDMVFVVLEHIDEAMAALHIACGWDLKLLVSIPSNCASCGHTLRRFDGRVVPPHPILTPSEEQILLERNILDNKLYLYSKRKWRKIQKRGGQYLAELTVEIQRQQSLLKDFCHARVFANPEIEAGDWVSYPGCIWLTLEAQEYEHIMNSEGWPEMDKPLELYHSHGGCGPATDKAKQSESYWECRHDQANVTMRMVYQDFERIYDEVVQRQL